jgi:hypothetical protein
MLTSDYFQYASPGNIWAHTQQNEAGTAIPLEGEGSWVGNQDKAVGNWEPVLNQEYT